MKIKCNFFISLLPFFQQHLQYPNITQQTYNFQNQLMNLPPQMNYSTVNHMPVYSGRGRPPKHLAQMNNPLANMAHMQVPQQLQPNILMRNNMMRNNAIDPLANMMRNNAVDPLANDPLSDPLANNGTLSDNDVQVYFIITFF